MESPIEKRAILFIAVVLYLLGQYRINQRIKSGFSYLLYNDHDVVKGQAVDKSDDGGYYDDTIEDHGNNYGSKMMNDDYYYDYDDANLNKQSNISTSNMGALVQDDILLQIQNYREERGGNFDSWFDKDNTLIRNADKNGAILDFAISGKTVIIILYESYAIMYNK